MATGTGLPIPKSGNVLSQSAPMVDGDKYSSAAAWTKIAHEGEQLAKTATDGLELAVKQQQARRVADAELDDTRWFTEARDLHQYDPDGFDAAAKGYMEGRLSETPSWDYDRRKKFLGGKLEGTYATLTAEKRSRDTHLATESLNARAKSADNDAMALASAGKVGTPEWDAAVGTYDGILSTAVSTGLMTSEKRQLIMEDFQARAQGELVSKRGVEIYREQGPQAANDYIRQQVLENEGLSIPVGKRYQIANRAMSQIKLAQAEDKADRALVVETARDLQKRITSNQDVDPGEVQDTLGALRRVGGIAQAARLSRDFAVRQATEPYRSGGVTLGQFGQQVAVMRGEDTALVQRESGGEPSKVNQFGYAGLYQYGAPRLEAIGVYKRGTTEDFNTWSRTPRNAEGKWSGQFNIPGFPEVRTVDDFRRSPEAQRAVRELDVRRMDADSAAQGLDRFIGQTVGGVPITREGIRNMMHLGGVGGAKAFLESGGAVNAQDANGTKVGEYAAMGARRSNAGDPSLPGDGAVVAQVQREFVSQSKASWPSFRQMIERGHKPDAEDFAAIRYAALVSGDAKWLREVDGLAGAALLGEAGKLMTEPQRKQALDNLFQTIDQSGWTADRESIFKSVKAQYDRQSQEVQKDPVSFGVRTTGAKVDPINLADGAGAMNALRQRVDIARGVAAGQGVPVASPLREADVTTVAAAIQSGQGAGAAFALLNAIPEDMLRATLDNKQLKDAITGAAFSSDPVRFNAVMQGLDQINSRDKAYLAADDLKEVKHRLMTWQSNYRYLGPERMTEELKRYADPAQAEARKRIEEEGRTEARKKSAADIVKGFDESWGITPGVIARNLTGSMPIASDDPGTLEAMKGDYETIYARRYRETNGDATKANEQTIELMKTRWSRSGVNGGKLMLQAPEKNYPAVAGSHDWMREQVEADLAAKLGPRESLDRGRGGMSENWTYTIVADRTTEAEANAPGQVLSEFDRKPYKPPVSYQVVVTDAKTGRTDVVRDEAQRPMRFRFDPTDAQRKAAGSFGVQRGYAQSEQWAETLDDNRRPFAVP